MKMRHESLAPRFNAKFVLKCYKKENEIGRGGGNYCVVNWRCFSLLVRTRSYFRLKKTD